MDTLGREYFDPFPTRDLRVRLQAIKLRLNHWRELRRIRREAKQRGLE